MNPTNNSCPTDIARFNITDYRPSKALYANIKNNNDFRLYMQRNGKYVRNNLLQEYVRSMNCGCESRPRNSIIPFDSSKLNAFERRRL